MLTWVESGGGPLILVPEQFRDRWRGTNPEEPVSGDYARACAAPDWVNSIDVDTGTGLVFWGEPMPAMWWEELPGSVGGVVRWEYADSDEAVEDFLRKGMPSAEAQEPLRVELIGPLLLFDAAWPSDEALAVIKVPIPSGVYEVTSEWLRQDRISLLIHRFVAM